MHAAIGTSLLVIALKSFAGLAGYITHVPIDCTAAAIVGGLAILGTVLGSRLARVLSGAQLRAGFGFFVLLVAAVLFVIEGSQLVTQMYPVERHLAALALAGLECAIALILIGRRMNGASQTHPLS